MLTMDLLKCANVVMRIKSVQPRAEGCKRLQRVEQFFKSPDVSQVLRRACLCLQLTGAVPSFTGLKKGGGAGGSPMLVRLALGSFTN